MAQWKESSPRHRLFLLCSHLRGATSKPDPYSAVVDGAAGQAKVDEVSAEFDRDARAAVRELLHDQANAEKSGIAKFSARMVIRWRPTAHRPKRGMSEPPDLTTPLVGYRWVLVRLRCDVCPCHAETRLAVMAARYGYPTAGALGIARLHGGCPWNPHTELRKPQNYSHRRWAYRPDIASGRPPDLPPTMAGLRQRARNGALEDRIDSFGRCQPASQHVIQ